MCQSEFQAAYELSMLTTETRRADEREIDRLIRNGFFVVVCEEPRYCRYTDATLPGFDSFISGIYRTRAEALAQVEEYYEYGDGRAVLI